MPFTYDPTDPLLFLKFRKVFVKRLFMHWLLIAGEIMVLAFLRNTTVVQTMVDNDVLKGVNSIFGGILSFYLVFVTKIVFDRWWNIRVLLGIVMGTSNDTGMLVAEYFDGQSKEAQALRFRLVRYLNLAHNLLYMQVKNERDLKGLEVKGILTPNERMLLESVDRTRYMVAYRWAQYIIVEAYKNKLILSDRWVSMIQANVTRARTACADVDMYINTPVPFPYIQQLFWCLIVFVYLNLPLLVLETDFWNCGFDQEACPKDAQCMWWPIMLALIVASAFLGLKEVAVELQDPFGTDDVDFPTDRFVDSTLTNTGMILGSQLKLAYLQVIEDEQALAEKEAGNGANVLLGLAGRNQTKSKSRSSNPTSTLGSSNASSRSGSHSGGSHSRSSRRSSQSGSSYTESPTITPFSESGTPMSSELSSALSSNSTAASSSLATSSSVPSSQADSDSEASSDEDESSSSIPDSSTEVSSTSEEREESEDEDGSESGQFTNTDDLAESDDGSHSDTTDEEYTPMSSRRDRK